MRRAPILAAALTLALASAPSSASADVYIGVGVGPAFRIDGWPTQFRLEFDVGYYFDAQPAGFFLAFAPAVSFLSDEYVFTFPLRLGGMFNVFRNDSVTFQLGPTGTVGFAVSGCSEGAGCDLKPWFHFSIAFMLRVLFADERVAFYVRPLEFEFAFGDDRRRWDDEAIRYVIAGGLQFHF